MTDDDFCRAFCSRLALREVPIGFVLKTPFQRPDGDPVAIYLRRGDGGTFRLEDDGETVGFIEANGVDLDSESRFEAFADLLKEYNAHFDEKEYVIHSSPIAEANVAAAAVQFSALLLRVQDLILMSTNRVRGTFRDDLVALIERQFGSIARIDYNAPIRASMRDYIVDVIVRSTDGKALAIYAGTSELKALEALLFWKECRDQSLADVRSMLVVETAKPRDIKERTFSRVMNSGLLLASMDGEEIAIGRKMRENVLS